MYEGIILDPSSIPLIQPHHFQAFAHCPCIVPFVVEPGTAAATTQERADLSMRRWIMVLMTVLSISAVVGAAYFVFVVVWPDPDRSSSV
jgi:hypothetical protein